MVCTSCAAEQKNDAVDPRWRFVLWIALAINTAMFGGEIVAGLMAGSRALQADALDFLGDAANYAISLMVAGATLRWRASAAMAKGATILAFGLYVAVTTIAAAFGTLPPHAATMGVVGAIALVANGGVALMLFRYREGDANRRSVWICSRNDAIGNAAVLLAALGVFGTGSAWPDLLVAAIMAALGLWGGTQILLHARSDLADARRTRERAERGYNPGGVC
jgi:Co/Zn/Cd efflux system component